MTYCALCSGNLEARYFPECENMEQRVNYHNQLINEELKMDEHSAEEVDKPEEPKTDGVIGNKFDKPVVEVGPENVEKILEEELRDLSTMVTMPNEVDKEEYAKLANLEADDLIDVIHKEIAEKGKEAGTVAAAEIVCDRLLRCKKMMSILKIRWQVGERTFGTLLKELEAKKVAEFDEKLKATRKRASSSQAATPRKGKEKLTGEALAMKTLLDCGYTEEQARAQIANVNAAKAAQAKKE